MSPGIFENQLAGCASERTRLRLTLNQKNSEKFRSPWYRKRNSAIIKSLPNHCDFKMLHDTISWLADVKPESKIQVSNKSETEVTSIGIFRINLVAYVVFGLRNRVEV